MHGPELSIRQLVRRNTWQVAAAFGVLVLAALAALTVTLDAVRETRQETVEELQPVHRLQLALARFDRQIHHYLIEPTPEGLRGISRGRTATDRAFQALHPVPFSAAEEKKAVTAARRAWQQAKQETAQILAAGKYSQGEQALTAMQRVMGLLHEGMGHLDRVYRHAFAEVEAQHRRAETANRNGLLFIAITALLGVALVVYTAHSVRQRLLGPLRDLEETARRLGQGELDHRARAAHRDELGHLAQTFNQMARHLQAHRQELTERASRDLLTGLDNREELFRRLEEESARALRHSRPLAVVMFDLDRFKAINDEHGHAVGDWVLEEFGRVVRDGLRRGDIAGRYGGEEFVVVLPETDDDAALEAAERIRLAFAGSAVRPPSGETLRVTVSAGVAVSLPSHPLSRQQLLERADRALYVAKSEGRNRVAKA